MILVVGATGQLGTAVVRRLAAAGQPVRAFVRPGSRHEHLRMPGIELSFGDLRDAASVDAACRGARVVITTANVVVPEGRTSFEAVEGQGYAHLIAACERERIEQFIFVSIPQTAHDAAVPAFRYKRLNEQRLKSGTLPYTVLRPSLFMDDWFAFIGDASVARGAAAATIERRYWFLRVFINAVGGLIRQHGIALIPGSRRARHAFIALDDVAGFIIGSIGREEMRRATFEIGGPQVLSWDEVLAIYARLLGKPIRAITVPKGAYRALRALLAPLSESASGIMGLNWLVGYDTPYDASALAARLGLQLTSAEQFLQRGGRASRVSSG
jgi:NADH dehydrogenase